MQCESAVDLEGKGRIGIRWEEEGRCTLSSNEIWSTSQLIEKLETILIDIICIIFYITNLIVQVLYNRYTLSKN